MSTATVWLCNFVVGVSVPPMIESAGFGTHVFFGIMCGLAGVWAVLFVPETKGLSLEELASVFNDTSGTEEKEMLKVAVGNVRRISQSYQPV